MKKLSQELLVAKVLERRKEKGLTQQQLADLTGINRALLSRLETSDFIPSIQQLEVLGDVLEFDIVSLFVDESKNVEIEKCSPLNIAVAGTGYVGLSLAVLLAQHNHVVAVDIIPEKVEMINNRKSPIQDDYIEEYLATKKLDLVETLDGNFA